MLCFTAKFVFRGIKITSRTNSGQIISHSFSLQGASLLDQWKQLICFSNKAVLCFTAKLMFKGIEITSRTDSG